MSQPGWYPDPSGLPGHFRHWDGQQWSATTTTDPASMPQGPAVASAATPTTGTTVPGPARSRRPSPWLIALGVVLATALLGYLGTRIRMRDDPVVVPPSVPASSIEPTPESPSSAESTDHLAPDLANCSAGNNIAVPRGTPGTVRNSGLRLNTPTDWGFRLDKDQWTWLDDIWSYGKVSKTPESERTVTVARVPESTPTGADGVRQQWLCWTNLGFLQDLPLPDEIPVAPHPVSVGGLRGHESVVQTSTPDGPITIRIGVYETQGAHVAVLGYYDSGAAANGARSELEKAFASITAD